MIHHTDHGAGLIGQVAAELAETEVSPTTNVERLKQALIDETGAALWENWLPLLDELIEAVRVEERAKR